MQLSEEEKKEIIKNKEAVMKNIHRSAAFQRVFKGADGVLALEEIDRFCGYKNDTFPQGNDPYEHAYNAGRRSAAVFIHNALEEDVEKYRMVLDAETKTK